MKRTCKGASTVKRAKERRSWFKLRTTTVLSLTGKRPAERAASIPVSYTHLPGGGVCALRGEPNVQGATDMGMLVNEQPAYLKWSNTTDRDTLAHWLSSQTYSDGYYTNKPKFMVSALKEWYGENATVENDYGYDWWPKVPSHDGSDWSEMSSFEKMKEGTMKGYYAWGMNPCHSAPNSGNVRRSMANCDWVVVVDQVITETASFWDAPDMNAEEIGTTCYFLPCALIYLSLIHIYHAPA